MTGSAQRLASSPLVLALACGLPAVSASVARADGCCFQPTYRLQCETVLEPQTVQRFRVAYDTEYVTENVTSYRPVLKTRTEERVYRVAKPIVETRYREETYTIWKPVVERSFRNEQVTRTKYVTETAEREEQVTTYRPVTETRYYQQQYTVQRPVIETQYRDQQYTVQRPVVETQLQTQQYTALRPVTTMENQTVDMGGYVAQQFVQPGSVHYALRPVQDGGGCGLLGLGRRSSYYWTPTVTAPTVSDPVFLSPESGHAAGRPNLLCARDSASPGSGSSSADADRGRHSACSRSSSADAVRDRCAERPGTNHPFAGFHRGPQDSLHRAATGHRNVHPPSPGTDSKVGRRASGSQGPRADDPHRVRDQTRAGSSSVLRDRGGDPTGATPVLRKRVEAYYETVMVRRPAISSAPISYYDPFSPAIRTGYSSILAAG